MLTDFFMEAAYFCRKCLQDFFNLLHPHIQLFSMAWFKSAGYGFSRESRRIFPCGIGKGRAADFSIRDCFAGLRIKLPDATLVVDLFLLFVTSFIGCFIGRVRSCG